MAKYHCKNCGHAFFVNVYRGFGASKECPKCESIWTEYVEPGLQSSNQKVIK